MKEVCDFLKSCGCFFLATEEGDQPRVRPFGVVEIYENRLYFLSGKKKNVAHQIEKNPKIEIVASRGEDILRYYGVAKFDDNPEVVEKAFAILREFPELQNY